MSDLKVHRDSDDRYEVWIDEGSQDYTGVCFGVGGTRERAIEDALRALTQHVESLRFLLMREVAQAAGAVDPHAGGSHV